MNNRLQKLFNKVFSRYVSTGLIFLLDVLLSFIAALLIIFSVHYIVSGNGRLASMDYWKQFVWVWLVASTVSAAFMFWAFKSYRIIIRHSSLADIFRFCVAVFCAMVLDGIILGAAGLWHPNTWIILLAYGILCVFLLIVFRVLMIRVYE